MEKITKNDLKKIATTIKNEQGFKAAADYLITNINNSKWDLGDKIALMKKAMPYILSAYSSKENALQFINSSLEEYDLAGYSATQIVSLGELYALVDNIRAIQFMDSQIDLFFEAKKGKDEFWLDIFQMYNSLYDLHIKENNFDFAFVTMRRAIVQGINWNDHPSIANGFLIRIYSNLSDFHLVKKKNPEYMEYLINKLKTIVLESIHEYFSAYTYNYEVLENLSELKGKNDVYIISWEESDLRAMELLGISDLQKFSEKFSEYIYNEAPLLVGNFELVLSSMVLKRIRTFRNTDITQLSDGEYRKYSMERDEIEKIENIVRSCFNPTPFYNLEKLHYSILRLLNFPESK
jgi:hypothetical protein